MEMSNAAHLSITPFYIALLGILFLPFTLRVGLYRVKNNISNINSINGTSRRERHLAACSRGIVGRWPPTALPRNYRLRPIPLSPYWHVRDAFYLLGRSCMDLS